MLAFLHALFMYGNGGFDYRLLQVLIQEMGVNIDLNFILAVTGLLGSLPNMQTDVSSTFKSSNMLYISFMQPNRLKSLEKI